MVEYPYSAPDHYTARAKPPVPAIAYLLTAGTLVTGVVVTALGFYLLLARTTLGGLACFGFGVFLASVIIQYRRQPG